MWICRSLVCSIRGSKSGLDGICAFLPKHPWRLWVGWRGTSKSIVERVEYGMRCPFHVGGSHEQKKHTNACENNQAILRPARYPKQRPPCIPMKRQEYSSRRPHPSQGGRGWRSKGKIVNQLSLPGSYTPGTLVNSIWSLSTCEGCINLRGRRRAPVRGILKLTEQTPPSSPRIGRCQAVTNAVAVCRQIECNIRVSSVSRCYHSLHDRGGFSHCQRARITSTCDLYTAHY